MEQKNSTYLILTIILVILSAIGGYFLFQLYSNSNPVTYNSNTVPKIELIPTDTIEEEIVPEIIITPIVITTIAPTKTITQIPTQIPTKIPTMVQEPTSSATNSATQKYTSTEDGFSVTYSSKRKFYQSTELSGNRYTFAYSSANFAIHTSPKGEWSWSHPERQFNDSLLVSGQLTFKYEIAAQTIVDLQSSDKNYTIQCIHNGVASLKTECDEFISSFKLL